MNSLPKFPKNFEEWMQFDCDKFREAWLKEAEFWEKRGDPIFKLRARTIREMLE